MRAMASELKELRESKGLSQRELARRSGVPTATINRLEQGNDRPSFKDAKKLADALALDIPVLCGVGTLNLPAFQSFAGDLAEQIEMTDPALDDWLARSLSERA